MTTICSSIFVFTPVYFIANPPFYAGHMTGAFRRTPIWDKWNPLIYVERGGSSKLSTRNNVSNWWMKHNLYKHTHIQTHTRTAAMLLISHSQQVARGKNTGTDNFGMDIFPALRTPFHSLNCSRTMQTNVEYYVQLTW